jgi:hypothetical protein
VDICGETWARCASAVIANTLRPELPSQLPLAGSEKIVAKVILVVLTRRHGSAALLDEAADLGGVGEDHEGTVTHHARRHEGGLSVAGALVARFRLEAEIELQKGWVWPAAVMT